MTNMTVELATGSSSLSPATLSNYPAPLIDNRSLPPHCVARDNVPRLSNDDATSTPGYPRAVNPKRSP